MITHSKVIIHDVTKNVLSNKLTINTVTYGRNVDQTKHLKYFDLLDQVWKEDVHTENPDMKIDIRQIMPIESNK